MRRSCTTGRQRQAGELLFVNAAGTYDGYTVDITRSYPVTGSYSEPQKDIYRLVLEAQEAGMRAAPSSVTRSPGRAFILSGSGSRSPSTATVGAWLAAEASFTHQSVRAAKSTWNAGRQRQTVTRGPVTPSRESAASRKMLLAVSARTGLPTHPIQDVRPRQVHWRGSRTTRACHPPSSTCAGLAQCRSWWGTARPVVRERSSRTR